MPNILNKSNHPVEVKKISVSMWRLRDEIEMAIAKEITEQKPEQADQVKIDHIKEFYISVLNSEEQTDSDEDSDEEQEDSNLDSSGNPLDDDAMAMMAALGGGEESEENSEENASEDENTDEEASDEESEEEVNGEEEDEAAKLAAQMLADQGMGTEEPSDPNSEDKKEEDKIDENKKVFTRLTPEEEKQSPGFVMLSDLNMDQLMIFSRETFIRGQNIIINFLIPKPFTIMAEVHMVSNFSRNSKVISPSKTNYRISCKTIFKFPGERDRYRRFLKSIEPTIPEPPKKLKRPDSDDDDDDFDDLGF